MHVRACRTQTKTNRRDVVSAIHFRPFPRHGLVGARTNEYPNAMTCEQLVDFSHADYHSITIRKYTYSTINTTRGADDPSPVRVLLIYIRTKPDN